IFSKIDNQLEISPSAEQSNGPEPCTTPKLPPSLPAHETSSAIRSLPSVGTPLVTIPVNSRNQMPQVSNLSQNLLIKSNLQLVMLNPSIKNFIKAVIEKNIHDW